MDKEMFEVDISIILILFSAALFAGFVDAIAGGGGIITLPALLFVGIPPIASLGTNKFQSCFGSFSACLHFYRNGYMNLKKYAPFCVLLFCTSMFGSYCVQLFSTVFLQKIIPFLLIAFALYFLFSRKITKGDEADSALFSTFGLSVVLGIIGFYDGFFGPGTGSFLLFALIILGGLNLITSLAHAKLFNFTTNIASMLTFAYSGVILWHIGLIMALGQFIGAYIGSRVAIGYGVKIIRPLVVSISLIVCVHLLYKAYF